MLQVEASERSDFLCTKLEEIEGERRSTVEVRRWSENRTNRRSLWPRRRRVVVEVLNAGAGVVSASERRGLGLGNEV